MNFSVLKKDQRGQSIVELALILPVLLILFMGVIEFGRIFHNYLIITNASREGARIAILGKSDQEINNRISSVSFGLSEENLQTQITPSPEQRKTGILTTVEVRYNLSLLFPLFSSICPDPLTLTSKTTMQIE